MDLERKLELLKRYDFSELEHGTRKYKEDGIGQRITGLVGKLSYLDVNSPTWDLLYKRRGMDMVMAMYADYGSIRTKYDSIDFDELDREDPDFQILFEINSLLPKLGRAIHEYVRYYFKCCNDAAFGGKVTFVHKSPQYKAIDSLVVQIYEISINYREAIKRIEQVAAPSAS